MPTLLWTGLDRKRENWLAIDFLAVNVIPILAPVWVRSVLKVITAADRVLDAETEALTRQMERLDYWCDQSPDIRVLIIKTVCLNLTMAVIADVIGHTVVRMSLTIWMICTRLSRCSRSYATHLRSWINHPGRRSRTKQENASRLAEIVLVDMKTGICHANIYLYPAPMMR